MQIVIYSSIVIARLLVDEPLHAQAKAFMLANQKEEMCAPRLFRFETSAVLRKAAYTNRLSHADGLLLLDQALALSITFYDDDDLHRDAYQLAHQLRQPRAYDTQYLALAQRLRCDCWTTDETLVNAISRGLYSGTICLPSVQSTELRSLPL